MSPPPLWPKLVTEWWQLTPGDGDRLWWALEHARYSRPVALRQSLALPGTVPLDLHYFLTHVLTPHVAMEVVEDLVHEIRLPRAMASRIEERILREVTAQGGWK